MKTYNGSQTPVGVDMANGYGLYDIAGNVSEDCWDWSDSGYYGNPGAETNPHGPNHRHVRELPVLPPVNAAEDLTARLLTDRIIPSTAADDAAHIGLAAAHKMDFLLTWNCTHINNRYILRRIERACAASGLACPVICTPDELMNLHL